MSDQHTVELARPAGPPPPPYRRPRWIIWGAALAALALAAVLSMYFGLRSDSKGARSPAQSAGPSPSTSAPAVVIPSPSSASPSTAPSALRTPAPDGRISYAALQNATLDIPPWPKDGLTGLTGWVTFHNGTVTVPPDAAFPFERHMMFGGEPVYGDVDGDGAQETLVLVEAVIQGGGQQLLALDRDASGRIATLGTVVADTGQIRVIDDRTLSVTSYGTIQAKVGDYQRCCGDQTPQQWQLRSYHWTGARFVQTGGLTSFPDNPAVTETSVRTGELVLAPPVGAVRYGTLTVTVGHLYGTVPDHLRILFLLPAQLRPAGMWPVYYVPSGFGSSAVAVDVRPPARGASAVYTFEFRLSVKDTVSEFQIDVHGMTAKNAQLSDSNPYNNDQTVKARTGD